MRYKKKGQYNMSLSLQWAGKGLEKTLTRQESQDGAKVAGQFDSTREGISKLRTKIARGDQSISNLKDELKSLESSFIDGIFPLKSGVLVSEAQSLEINGVASDFVSLYADLIGASGREETTRVIYNVAHNDNHYLPMTKEEPIFVAEQILYEAGGFLSSLCAYGENMGVEGSMISDSYETLFGAFVTSSASVLRDILDEEIASGKLECDESGVPHVIEIYLKDIKEEFFRKQWQNLAPLMASAESGHIRLVPGFEKTLDYVESQMCDSFEFFSVLFKSLFLDRLIDHREKMAAEKAFDTQNRA
jgi:hypothetical protein